MLSCSVSDYIPRGPSLSDDGADWWLRQETRPVSYTGDPAKVDGFVPPFQLMALTYVEDIVIETDHPRWAMHEYARVELDGESYWMAKDADRAGVQTVTADLDDLSTWLPEIPAPRRVGAVAVEDRSTPERLDVSLAYDSPDGERVEVDFSSPRPQKTESKRNGSTFNHSSGIASVVLDIPGRQLADVEASVRYDGQPAQINTVLGLAPVAALLHQSQAGFAVSSMRVYPGEAEIDVSRPIPGGRWPTSGREVWSVDGAEVVSASDTRTARYALEDGGLAGVTITEAGADAPTLELALSAPLPDLARPFYGRVTRHFAVYVNGQLQGHGEIVAAWDTGADAPWLQVMPVAPAWFAERPIQTTIRFTGDGGAEIRSRRI